MSSSNVHKICSSSDPATEIEITSMLRPRARVCVGGEGEMHVWAHFLHQTVPRTVN